jgi:hypothetical protein
MLVSDNSGSVPVCSRYRTRTCVRLRPARALPYTAGRGVSDENLASATAVHVHQEMEELVRTLRNDAACTRPGASASEPAAHAAPGLGRGGARTLGADGGKHATAAAAAAGVNDASCGGASALLLLETAGGVTSPAPSGRLTVRRLPYVRHAHLRTAPGSTA